MVKKRVVSVKDTDRVRLRKPVKVRVAQKWWREVLIPVAASALSAVLDKLIKRK